MPPIDRSVIVVIFAVGFAVAGLSGCVDPKADSTSNASLVSKLEREGLAPSTYYFRLKYEDVWGECTVTINGFPVHQSGGGHIVNNPTIAPRLNTALVRGENQLTTSVEPFLRRRSDAFDIADVEFHGRVTQDYKGRLPIEGSAIPPAQVDSAHAAWSERARAQWQKYLAWEEAWLASNPDSTAARRARLSWTEGGALDSMRSWAQRHPMTVSTTFDNHHGPDFSALFEEAPVIEGTPADSARLKNYAMHLRDLMASGQATALFEEVRYRMRYNKDSSVTDQQLISDLDGSWLFTEANHTFERSEVRLTKWSNGRLWELYVHPDTDFFHTSDGADMPAYVAKIDGSLRVVR